MDNNQINNKKNKKVGKIIGFSCLGLATCLILGIGIPFLCAMVDVSNDFKVYRKDYSINELQKIKESSFKYLNEIEPRDSNLKTGINISNEYKQAVNNFANLSYKSLDKVNNISYSPYGLYSNLVMMSLSSNNEMTLAALDSVLGLNKETRKNDFINMYVKDFFSNENGTLQFYNAAFMNNKWDYNPSYINELTSYMVEAFQLDFTSNSDIDKMLGWVDDRMNDKDFLSPKDLQLDADSSLYLFSTMYFDNKWMHPFKTSNTYEGNFYLADNLTTKAQYMTHTYYGTCYDYGNYVSCYDYYCNKMKIKYLITKDGVDKSIYELVKDQNIFIDNPDNLLVNTERNYQNDEIIVNLATPKFENECLIDFNDTLHKMGLSYLYNSSSRSFNYAFSDLKEDESMYLSFVKQKNKVSFSEDGTVVKSVSFSGMKASSAGPMTGNTIDITLDRPFIYIIYDSNDIPIYVGNMDNPK